MKKILYVDMDNVLVDFKSGIDQLSPEIKEKYANDLDEVPGIFSLMKPMAGAIEAYKKLSEVYDTYILSTAPWENPSAWSDKLLWVKKYLGKVAYKRLILSHNKHLNAGDYLIDDRTANGTDKFTGEHIHFATDKFPDWQSVLSYLLRKEEAVVSKKFRSIPIEKGTTILQSIECKFGELDAVYQKWIWDGIRAESIILANDDITQISDEDLYKEIDHSNLLKNGSKKTLQRSDSGFTFINFNFTLEE